MSHSRPGCIYCNRFPQARPSRPGHIVQEEISQEHVHIRKKQSLEIGHAYAHGTADRSSPSNVY